MSCVPKIDQPCPLAAAARAQLSDYCGQCGKSVHALDALDAAQRRALLQQARGPICVSYRVSAGLGAMLALSAAGPAAATASSDAASPLLAPVSTPSILDAAQPSTAKSSLMSPAGAAKVSEEECEELDMIVVGGVSRPGEAEWIDEDSTLPQLPLRDESEFPEIQEFPEI